MKKKIVVEIEIEENDIPILRELRGNTKSSVSILCNWYLKYKKRNPSSFQNKKRLFSKENLK